MTRRRMAALALLGVSAAALTACAPGNPGMVTTEIREVTAPDGRTVTCVVAVEGGSGSTGVSCDWGT